MHGECVLALAHAHRAQQLPALGIYARSDAHDKAVAYLEQAGDQAQGQHAHATAEGYYRDLVERDPPSLCRHTDGLIFWLRRNRLLGSYLFFSSISRA
jgi:hypothetical protein